MKKYQDSEGDPVYVYIFRKHWIPYMLRISMNKKMMSQPIGSSYLLTA